MLKPISTAFDAEARLTSLGVMRADAGVDDADVDLAVREALHARAQRFDRALTVGLEDEVERLLAAVGRHRHEALERDARSAAGGDAQILTAHGAFGGGFARDAFVGDDHQRVAGGRERRRDR